MKIKVKLWIENENQELIFGDGKNEIMTHLDATNCVEKTAQLMNLSEDKVLNHLNIVENHLDDEMVLKTQGLKKDSKASYVLTPEAREILQTYQIFQHDVKKFANKKLDKFLWEIK